MLGSDPQQIFGPESLDAYMAISQLRRFAKYLQTFPQVEVTAWFGAAGGGQAIQQAKQNGLHPDIIAFHSIMNGCSFRWRFCGNGITLRDGDGGFIEIPTIDQLAADRARYGVESNPTDRIQVVDRAALTDGSPFPFYMHGDDLLHAFDGDQVDYCPGTLSLLVLEGISHLFSPGWLGSYGEFVPPDDLERAQGAEAENRRQLKAFALGDPYR